MLSLQLRIKGIFGVSEQCLVDQANTIHRNSQVTEGKSAEDHARHLLQVRSVDEPTNTNNKIRKEVRNNEAILETDEEINNSFEVDEI